MNWTKICVRNKNCAQTQQGVELSHLHIPPKTWWNHARNPGVPLRRVVMVRFNVCFSQKYQISERKIVLLDPRNYQL